MPFNGRRWNKWVFSARLKNGSVRRTLVYYYTQAGLGLIELRFSGNKTAVELADFAGPIMQSITVR